ncbi:hypothetical protein [Dulcicalothrix desertica]|uniref:hypothetical protein n=1 Tax=Dulcicalothrix desertica TaxID=32056 RepID=UPI000F8EFCE6|nr:hypothetical protein [Dulcicalothrix desertica]
MKNNLVSKTRNSLWVLIILTLLALAPSLVILLDNNCNSVSLVIKAWGLEYRLFEGGCDIQPKQ